MTSTAYVFLSLFYVAFQGWKAKSCDTSENTEPLNDKQKKTLILLGIMILCIIIPAVVEAVTTTSVTAWMKKSLDIQVMCVLCGVACIILKLGDEREVIRTQIPWNIIFMIGGIVMLTTIANENGAADLIAASVSAAVPTKLVPSVVTFIAVALSFFSGYPVIFPLLIPLCPAFAAAGVDEVACLTGILLCTSLGGASPFSTGGSALLSRCDDE